MSTKIWERYYQYGVLALAQNHHGEASRQFLKALHYLGKASAGNLSASQAQARITAKLEAASIPTLRYEPPVSVPPRFPVAMVTAPANWLS